VACCNPRRTTFGFDDGGGGGGGGGGNDDGGGSSFVSILPSFPGLPGHRVRHGGATTTRVRLSSVKAFTGGR